MKKTELAVKKADSILDELSQHFQMIRQRAFELYQSRPDSMAGEWDNWFEAERAVSLEPPVELRRANGEFEIDAALPGVDPKDLKVQVTAEDVLITAEIAAERKLGETQSESVTRLFRAVHLPMPINPDAVKADYRHGLLHLTAPIVEPATRTIEVRT